MSDNIKPHWLPGDCIIFSGKDIVFRPEKEIKPEDIQHEYFSVTAVEDSIPEVDKRIMEIVTDFPFTKSRLADLAIALSEAVTNAIINGSQDGDREISIDIIFIPKVMLYIIVRDDLGEIDLKDINFGIFDTFDVDESGCGFLIIANLVNVFAYIPGCKNLKEIFLGLKPEND